MFTGLVRDQIILRRLGMVDVEEFLELPGATPFIAMGGDRMKQWGVTREQIKKSSEYDPSDPVKRDRETRLHDHYGRPSH